MDKVSNKKGDFKKAGDGIKKMFSNLNPWSKKSKQNREKVRAKMGLNPEAPPKKPELVSSKFKIRPDGSQQKITIPSRLKEIEREDAMDNIKKVAQRLKHGGRAKPYGMKYGGKPYGMKRGGKPKGSICRGMGAATRGGKYTAT